MKLSSLHPIVMRKDFVKFDRSCREPSALLAAFLVLWMACDAAAHDVPRPLPEPQSVLEAWNVIEESAANVDQLLQTGLVKEVVYQIVNTGGAIGFLKSDADKDVQPEKVRLLADRLTRAGFDVIVASREPLDALAQTRAKWTVYRTILKDLESRYIPEALHAAIYICPMHPTDRHLNSDARCAVCGMSLVRRHLPASAIYEKPGEPTLKMDVACGPLVAGQATEIKIHLRKGDGSAVVPDDLLEMHTQRIHLLINDRSLSDYHHEHPKPSGVRGEFVFTFTPAKPGPYRIWADVIPTATGVQEYVIADIPPENLAAPSIDGRIDQGIDRQTILTTVVEGANTNWNCTTTARQSLPARRSWQRSW